jgi:hypothetical protein
MYAALLINWRGVMRVQAVGGAVAVVVGVYMTNFVGPDSSRGRAVYGEISLQDSIVEFQRNRVTNCMSVSVTDSSLGTSSVFGGALAMLHSPQVSNFELALLQAMIPARVNGFNVTVLIYNSHFFQCSVFSNSSSGRLGDADGGGGAIFAKSVALTNFSVAESLFSGITVSIASGATGLPSFSSGGALSVEAGISNSSFFAISSSRFFNCTVQGANIANMGVLGGAVHVFRAAYISVVRTNFTNCSVIDADSASVVVNSISGGSAMSAVVTCNMSVLDCVFDASGSQDSSQTSAGLLVLARNASNARVNVSSCNFISAAVVLSVQCVGSDGFRRLVGSCVGLNMTFRSSRVLAVSSQSHMSRFSATGNDLITFHHQDAVFFTESRLHCALPEFAAFKTEIRKSSTRSTVFSCRPCPSNQISLTASAVMLEELSSAKNADRCYPAFSNSSGTSVACPFAVPDCTTFINVSRGFWMNISETGQLEEARRCPRGYCGCADDVKGLCPLPPLISINRNRNPLCIGNRIGKLCGGCPPDFTQSMDDRTCISNEACSRSLWWVWTLSVLGFAVYSLYIVLSCLKRADGAFACLVFYFQMSSFLADEDQPDGLVSILEYAQVHSVAAMYRGACYAPSMSAYNATAFKLIGPLLVLMFAVAWTWIIQKLQPRLQQRNIDLSVSYSGTLAVTVLFVFSSISNVVFTLVECSRYSFDDVVFIDGTEPCMDAKWSALVFVAVLLFLFPVAFAAALRLKRGFQRARDAVSSKFTGPAFYWGAVTLSFRLLISAAQFLRVDYPNLMAFVRMLLSVGVFSLLLYLRPYVYVRAFFVDVACYVCLIAQFGLQIFARTREFLGVAESSMTKGFFTEVLIWSLVIR